MRGVRRDSCELKASAVQLCRNMKVLSDAVLVTDRPKGTSRVYYIDPNGLGALRAWLDQFWDQTLARFQAEVELSVRNQKDKAK